MTLAQKNDIVALIETEKVRLGSGEAVAAKVKISSATISNMLNVKWADISTQMWRKVGDALGYRPSGWQMAEINNTRIMAQVLMDAKEKHLHIAVSYRAGSGKTAAIKEFAAANASSGVYALMCREWGRKEFLVSLCATLGIATGRGLNTPDAQLQAVCEALNKRANLSPLLVIDEADKLRPAALRALITLYNETEGRVGVVIAGTENLRIEVQRGIKLGVKGMDEIDSRFGRRYIQLGGISKTDVKAICAANGLADAGRQEQVWNSCEPYKTVVNDRTVQLVDDLRRVRRCVEREMMMRESESLTSESVMV